MSQRRLPRKSRKLFLPEQLLAALCTTSACARVWEHMYSHHILGIVACKRVFMEVNKVKEHTYRKLQDLAESTTAEIPTDGGQGRLAHNQKSLDVVEQVVASIKNTASTFGLPQPAAPRGGAQVLPIYSPATHSRTRVYKEYSKSVSDDDSVSYWTFCCLRELQAHDVIVMKPCTDVCY